jgi:hypothetical protein
MDIQVKTDLKQLQKKLDILRDKTFNKVMSEGINHTSAMIVNAQRQQLLKKLHKPKKTSITAIVMSKFAKPNKRGLKATVRVKSYATKFLYYIYTGENEPARSQSYPSPTKDGRVKANTFGNIVTQKGIIKRVDKTEKSNRKGSRFVGVPKGKGSKVYGIWERQGQKGREGLNLLVAFTPFIRHKKFIDWFKLSHKVVKNNLYKEINKQMIKRVRRAMR